MNILNKMVLSLFVLGCLLPIIQPSITHGAYPTSFRYEAENMLTDPSVGLVKGTGEGVTVMEANTIDSNAGYLVYGPYSSDQLAEKAYRVTYRLRVKQNSLNPVVRLDINNAGNEVLSERDLYSKDFSALDQFQDFSLDFVKPLDGVMEYRVWYYKQADVQLDLISVRELTPVERTTFESENLFRNVGQIVDDTDASNSKAVLTTSTDGEGYAQYGPYTAYQEPNNTYVASFRLKVNDNTSSNTIARLDINNSHGNAEWIYKDIKGTDFSTTNEYYFFNVNFDRNNTGTLEFRVYSYGITDLYIDKVSVSKINQNSTTYESENLFRAVGSIVNDSTASSGQAVKITSLSNGYGQYGPYTIDQNSGDSYKAVFRMKVNNNTSDSVFARIDVNNYNGNADWRYRNIKANDFAKSNNYEDFDINFSRTNSGVMEYRVYVFGNSENIDLTIDKVDIYKVNQNEWIYEAENSSSSVGGIMLDSSASNGKAREATISINNQGYIVYGPYSDELPHNKVYTANFRLKTNTNNVDNKTARIEFSNPGGNGIYVSKDIKSNDFQNTNTWQDFKLNFTRNSGGSLEFRVWFYDLTDVRVDKITVIPLDNSSIVYQGESMLTGVGNISTDATADGGYVMKATQGSGQNYLVYGPYTYDQEPGNYEVVFRLKRPSSVPVATKLVRIEAVNNGGTGAYVWKDLSKNNIGDNFTDVSLNFYRNSSGSMEYRVYFYDVVDISLDKITVNKI